MDMKRKGEIATSRSGPSASTGRRKGAKGTHVYRRTEAWLGMES